MICDFPLVLYQSLQEHCIFCIIFFNTKIFEILVSKRSAFLQLIFFVKVSVKNIKALCRFLLLCTTMLKTFVDLGHLDLESL